MNNSISPKVSIIIPVFNVENYLDKCFDSLLNQTLKEIEIICFNDASTDSSLKILKKYAEKDARIKIIDSPINVKQGEGRNAGIRMAKAPYIMFVDPDDWVDDKYVETYYNEAINSDSDIVTGGYIAVTGDKKEEINYWELDSNADTTSIKKNHLKRNACIVTNMYKKKLFTDNCLFFPSNIQIGEDRVIASPLFLSATKISKIDSFHYYYRFNPKSSTREGDIKKFYMRLMTPLMTWQLCNNLDGEGKYKEEITFQLIDQFFRQNIIGTLDGFSRILTSEIKFINNTIRYYVSKKDMNRYFETLTKGSKLEFKTMYYCPVIGIICHKLLNFYRRLK